ncbi:DUF2188 domain-containing protein [Tepidicaulis sp. LMO-SS28]|uniref:DUF2188 domain-containing protein n=1 Tax=Tepidicaulis sp. LMO-SS28 TaxID=3447455 RepID=UPI003EE29F11
MSPLTYEVVEHDGGWAYKVGDVYSECYQTREAARAAAERAAAEHETNKEPTDEIIEYQDEEGTWRREVASGKDRPDTDVEG